VDEFIYIYIETTASGLDHRRVDESRTIFAKRRTDGNTYTLSWRRLRLESSMTQLSVQSIPRAKVSQYQRQGIEMPLE
jgi:hypothetical protein